MNDRILHELINDIYRDEFQHCRGPNWIVSQNIVWCVGRCCIYPSSLNTNLDCRFVWQLVEFWLWLFFSQITSTLSHASLQRTLQSRYSTFCFLREDFLRLSRHEFMNEFWIFYKKCMREKLLLKLICWRCLLVHSYQIHCPFGAEVFIIIYFAKEKKCEFCRHSYNISSNCFPTFLSQFVQNRQQ